MIQLAALAAVAAVIGGVVAITARDSRTVAFGLLMAMVAAPAASSPEPSTLAMAFRVLGALLAAYLLWAAAGAGPVSSEGSSIGPTAELTVAVAAFCLGWFATPVKPLAGPVAAQAAGVCLIALAVVPLAGRNVVRIGVGAAMVTLGASLLLQAWTGPASPLEHVLIAGLLVGVVGATSLLMSPAGSPEIESDDQPAPDADAELEPEPAEDVEDVVEPKPDQRRAPQAGPTSDLAPIRERHVRPREPRR
jgi:hypothetical protein